MAEKSKPIDLTKGEAQEVADITAAAQNDSGSDDEQDDAPPSAGASSSSATGKKKRSKKKKVKAAIGLGDSGDSKPTEVDLKNAVSKLSKAQLTELLAMNPALQEEVGAKPGEKPSSQALEALKNLSLEDIMTGLAASGKNAKDIASYTFWKTQPVPQFGDNNEKKVEEGPFKIIDPEKVSKEPAPLTEGFEWVTMDLTNDEEVQEVFELLSGHYVEDNEALFRFNYSTSFLRW